MSNLSDLKAALIVAAADISNAIDKLECLALIDDWYLLRSEIAANSQPGVTSYSIGGRSVTRQQLESAKTTEQKIYQQIRGYLYKEGIAYADMRSDDNNWSQTT